LNFSIHGRWNYLGIKDFLHLSNLLKNLIHTDLLGALKLLSINMNNAVSILDITALISSLSLPKIVAQVISPMTVAAIYLQGINTLLVEDCSSCNTGL
jgi:hypothetical protein